MEDHATKPRAWPELTRVCRVVNSIALVQSERAVQHLLRVQSSRCFGVRRRPRPHRLKATKKRAAAPSRLAPESRNRRHLVSENTANARNFGLLSLVSYLKPLWSRQSQGLCRQRPKEPKTHRAETRRRWPARNHREQHDRRERHRRCCTAVRPHRRRRDKARGYADKDQKSQRPTERKLGVAGSPRTIVDSTMHEEHSSRDRR